MKLANSGNPIALYRVGSHYLNDGLDKEEGMRWYRRAAEAGSSSAAHNLGLCYMKGDGVEQNLNVALEYFQKAASLGGAQAFVLIGSILMQQGATEEGYLNFRKAAMCGLDDKSLSKVLRMGYRNGYISKEEMAATLRENQKASDDTKSESREKWQKIREAKGRM